MPSGHLSLKNSSRNLTSRDGNTRSPWVVVVTGSLSTIPITEPIPSPRMVFSTCSQLLLLTQLVRALLGLVAWTCGVDLQLIYALVMPSTVVRETLPPVETISTQSRVPDLDPSTLSASSMVSWRSRLSSQRVTGFGQQFGFFQLIMLMVNGQHLEKSISLNPEVTMPNVNSVEETHSVPLFIGDQAIQPMPGKKLMPTMSTQLISPMISTFTNLTGPRITSEPMSMIL